MNLSTNPFHIRLLEEQSRVAHLLLCLKVMKQSCILEDIDS